MGRKGKHVKKSGAPGISECGKNSSSRRETNVTAATIATETMDAIEKGWYHDENKKNITIKDVIRESVENTILYTPQQFKSHNFIGDSINLGIEGNEENIILLTEVKNQTTLEATKELVESKKYKNVCALNFASAKNPGGGFLHGEGAQEESIARASGLYTCLTSNQVKGYYENNRKDNTSLYTHHIIYSPSVPVFRTNEGDWLSPFYKVSFISSPAPNAGVARRKLDKRNADETIKSILQERIQYILTIAARNQCDALVLGAFGCGVFRNDPNEVANTFNRLLNNQFKGCFSYIVFAIPNFGPSENIEPFSRLFNN